MLKMVQIQMLKQLEFIMVLEEHLVLEQNLNFKKKKNEKIIYLLAFMGISLQVVTLRRHQ